MLKYGDPKKALAKQVQSLARRDKLLIKKFRTETLLATSVPCIEGPAQGTSVSPIDLGMGLGRGQVDQDACFAHGIVEGDMIESVPIVLLTSECTEDWDQMIIEESSDAVDECLLYRFCTRKCRAGLFE